MGGASLLLVNWTHGWALQKGEWEFLERIASMSCCASGSTGYSRSSIFMETTVSIKRNATDHGYISDCQVIGALSLFLFWF
jgi:hypothetical protein